MWKKGNPPNNLAKNSSKAWLFVEKQIKFFLFYVFYRKNVKKFGLLGKKKKFQAVFNAD